MDNRPSNIVKLIDRNKAVRGGLVGYEDRGLMVELYVGRGLSLRQMATELSCSLRTVARWMKLHEIEIRGVDERLQAVVRKKADPSVRACVECGEPRSPGRRTKRCLKCRSAGMRGSGNPNFRGKSDVSTAIRSWCAKHWRPLVFARDLYTCVRCGDGTGGNLAAHHNRQLSEIIDDIKSHTNPDLTTATGRQAFVDVLKSSRAVTDVGNGVTLCVDCHAEVHRTLQIERNASMYEYSATLERVIDGDTVVLSIDLGLETFRRIKCRLCRINAPEMKTPAGPAAKEYLAGLLAPDETFTVRTIKDRTEKYGRYLVEMEGSHGNVSDAMLAAGQAVRYDG